MVTIREFIVSQSDLPSGYTIREHIKHPKPCVAGSGGFIYSENPIKVADRIILKCKEATPLLIETERICVV